MLCERCNEAEATIHQVIIEENEVNHYHLCENCAEEVKKEQQDSESTDLMSKAFSSLSEAQREATDTCPRCGLKFEEFKQRGRVGCAECYTAFKNEIKPLIKRIHGSDQHVGLSSQSAQLGKVSTQRKKQMLQKELDRCVKEENYEEAAELRDRISELKDGNTDVSAD